MAKPSGGMLDISLFTLLFSEPGKMLKLYNALSGMDIPADTHIDVATLSDVLFMKQLNDLAFVVGGKAVVLIEYQSTVCGNLPLRLLLYVARVYEKLVDKEAAFHSKQIKIPRPDFFVLYNGDANYPDRKTVRLSDAFADAGMACAGGFLELEVTVLNINAGRNIYIVSRCEELRDYVTFVSKVKEFLAARHELQNAITEAIEFCISHDVLAEFLREHSSEVINMLMAEFEMATAQKVWLEEGREEGREEGLTKGREEGLTKGREEGLTKGREEGLTKGREEGIISVAKGLLADGDSVDRIIKVTGLAREAVENMRDAG